MKETLLLLSPFCNEETKQVLVENPPDSPLQTSSPRWGVSQSRPSAGPLLGLDGDVSAPYRAGRPGHCSPTLSFPVLSRVGTYLAGPRARRGHRPRSSFPGSGRVPSCRVAPQQEPGPAPASRWTNRAVPVTAAPNPKGGAGDSLRVPPPGLQHPSDSGPGRGGAAARWLGSLRREDPLPPLRSECGRLRSRGVREAGNLDPVPPTHSGMKIPQTTFRVRKLRSSEKSDYLQELRGK